MINLFDERWRITQNAKMQHRCRFLEKWLAKKWVAQARRGKYELTEAGEVALKVFG
jgi:hypothetical protein